MPRPGELKHTIVIKSPTVFTESTSGGKTPDWAASATFATARAKIEPLRGQETLDGGIQNAEVDHRIWIWYRPGVTTKQRIFFGSREFDIVQATNFREESEWLEIVAKEHRPS